MLPYAGYIDPESTLATAVHHVGHLEDTELTIISERRFDATESVGLKSQTQNFEAGLRLGN